VGETRAPRADWLSELLHGVRREARRRPGSGLVVRRNSDAQSIIQVYAVDCKL
jgi:hypothetical protein